MFFGKNNELGLSESKGSSLADMRKLRECEMNDDTHLLTRTHTRTHTRTQTLTHAKMKWRGQERNKTGNVEKQNMSTEFENQYKNEIQKEYVNKIKEGQRQEGEKIKKLQWRE